LSGNAVHLSVLGNKNFTGTVATFKDANPLATAGDFTATIMWDDNTTSPGLVSGGGPFTVTGSHQFRTFTGTHHISIQINDVGGKSITVLDNVVDPPYVPRLPFHDDFSSESQLGGYWTQGAGKITIAGGAAVGQASINLATVAGIEVADVTVQADVAVSALHQWAGLIARYDEGNMYFAVLENTSTGLLASIERYLHGRWTTLASAKATGDHGTLGFQVKGSRLKLWWDGTLLASATDHALGRGSIGLRIGKGAAVDDFLSW
jgi:hypothetical protein